MLEAIVLEPVKHRPVLDRPESNLAVIFTTRHLNSSQDGGVEIVCIQYFEIPIIYYVFINQDVKLTYLFTSVK
jgi:hypothetical protein